MAGLPIDYQADVQEVLRDIQTLVKARRDEHQGIANQLNLIVKSLEGVEGVTSPSSRRKVGRPKAT